MGAEHSSLWPETQSQSQTGDGVCVSLCGPWTLRLRISKASLGDMMQEAKDNEEMGDTHDANELN